MDAKRRPRARASGKTFALAGALLGVAPAGARAQLLPNVLPASIPGYGVDPGVTVQTRLRPAFDALGIRLGGALVHPRLEESLGYDSNVLARSPASGSWYVRTSPSATVSGGGERASYSVYADLDDLRYVGLPAQDQTNWTIAGGTTLAVGQDHLTLGAASLGQHQSLGDIDALPTDRPVAYRVNDLRAAYAASLGRLSLEPNIDVATWRFGSSSIGGMPAPQSYRNRDTVQGGLTLRYAMAPLRDVALALRGAEQTYVATPPGATSPTSTSFAALAGFDDSSDGLWRYRLLAGYERRGFASAAYHGYGTFIAEADAVFSPGGMTTVTATLSRSIQDAAQEGVAGFVYNGAKLTIDYEWRRNVLLQASAGAQRADPLGGGGGQTILRAGVGATWLVNRRVRVSATYDAADSRGNGTAPSGIGATFTRSIGQVTIRLAL